MPEPRIRVYHGSLPLWLALAVLAPLGLVFLTSLVLAGAIVAAAAGLAALVLPRLWGRRSREPSDVIELDTSQYHRIESRHEREPRR
jgi:membrane protein implicated in regulation of membrane protease activity